MRKSIKEATSTRELAMADLREAADAFYEAWKRVFEADFHEYATPPTIHPIEAIAKQRDSELGAAALEYARKLGWTPPEQTKGPTDKQILQLGRSARDGTAHDAIVRELCVRALGLSSPSDPPGWHDTARERVAAAIMTRQRET